ncbi:hypothetical protein LTR37_012494 [Vermiconidia calcicola]|uniref:Uncharacterized protein n=1 Tax=Vermiconidia calcicola TaxID=1690605 RepID=A0ACC3MZ60_9PEZI|nr:hypothetical protein LTR37_012494 [Vermiconidia calcicola]
MSSSVFVIEPGSPATQQAFKYDYTRVIQTEQINNAKPRRRGTFYPKAKKHAAVSIFEDVLENEELVLDDRREAGKNTLLGRPAQKLRKRLYAKHHELVSKEPRPLQTNSECQWRSPLAAQPAIFKHERERTLRSGGTDGAVATDANNESELKKEPRRRTIFVPSDDTTMLTIHPGAKTTGRLDDTFQLMDFELKPSASHQESEPPEVPIATLPAKRPRMSLAAAPKRLPLQQVAVHDNTPAVDVAGQNGGKENVPPIAHSMRQDARMGGNALKDVDKPKLAGSSLLVPTAASRARQSVVPRNSVPLSKVPANTSRPHPPPAERKTLNPMSGNTVTHSRAASTLDLPGGHPAKHCSPGTDAASSESRRRAEGQRSKPRERKVARLAQYPVLIEDLAQSELYEDSWLSHQEVSLSELVNEIFRSAEPVQAEWERPKRGLRERLIAIYHQPSVTTLYRRLQASLLYGALSRPKDAPSPPDPARDIGLRKRFLGLWLDSYSQKSLLAAAEVVFGHQLPKRASSTSAAQEGTLDPHEGRRTLIGFLETFLIEVEDVEHPKVERGDDPNSRWRKMVLRSMMLIWLLDQAKATQSVNGCLFKSTSHRKTSTAMLQAVAGLLVPSVGDVLRVLRHLDLGVCHVQDPLDEVHYRIDSIAVDLRNGVLLTRLVELLLFSSNNTSGVDAAVDSTITVQLPDQTVVESALFDLDGARYPRLLSQHLRLPCLGRAQKLFNVELAISALRNHGRFGDTAFDITADDIVDGHRERTLSLLWSLVSDHGLEQLVDFEELIADIKRSLIDSTGLNGLPTECTHLLQPQQERLLQDWASVHCAKTGVSVGNLTTSFADGKAYAAILDAFATYTNLEHVNQAFNPMKNVHLEPQLRSFGCSAAFIKQLASSSGTIPSRKTTISNLAFLASRLLPMARMYNAAVVVQRCFRRRRGRIAVWQRLSLMRSDYACAKVVQTQNRLNAAATTLQRAWRNVLDARIKRLDSDVGCFQCLAKSWLLNRRVQRSSATIVVGSHSATLKGGW